MGHLDIDVDRPLPRRRIESCDLRLDRLEHEIEYDLDARLLEGWGHHAALAFPDLAVRDEDRIAGQELEHVGDDRALGKALGFLDQYPADELWLVHDI